MKKITTHIHIINFFHTGNYYKLMQSQFSNPKLFLAKVESPILHNNKNVSFWKTVQRIIQEKPFPSQDFVIIFKDSSFFTDDNPLKYLEDNIKEAQKLNADILLGEVNFFQTAIQVSKRLFWIETFDQFEFTILFRKFYPQILALEFNDNDDLDIKISSLTENKFTIFPFISTRKNSVNSTIIQKKDKEITEEKLELLKNVRQFYLPRF